MSWKSLQDQGSVEPHATSKGELDSLRAAIKRDLDDAALQALSADSRFEIAYRAALLAAKMAVSCAGYRVKGAGAHHVTFEALKLALGPMVNTIAAYLDRCRRKRHALTYVTAGVVSATDAAELLAKAETLYREVELWIAKHHPKLV